MSSNPYGIDALYDEDIYQDFVDKPNDELERIVEEIDTDETKYRDTEQSGTIYGTKVIV